MARRGLLHVAAVSAMVSIATGSALAQQIGPLTSLTVGDGVAAISVAASDCTIDAECRPITLACDRDGYRLAIRNLDAEEIGAWFGDESVEIALGDVVIGFSLRAVQLTDAWQWQADLAADEPLSILPANVATADALSLTTPSFSFAVELTQADRWHLTAFGESCAGTPADDACSLGVAVYEGAAGIITFSDGEGTRLSLLRPDGTAIEATHTGGQGRGANYYDAVNDSYFEYWFAGLRGEVARAATAETAPLTFTLEGFGDFLRSCPDDARS